MELLLSCAPQETTVLQVHLASSTVLQELSLVHQVAQAWQVVKPVPLVSIVQQEVYSHMCAHLAFTVLPVVLPNIVVDRDIIVLQVVPLS